MMFIGGIFLLDLFALVVYFLYNGGNLDFLKGNESPLDILDRRYAAGEISEEEYQKIKRTLIE